MDTIKATRDFRSTALSWFCKIMSDNEYDEFGNYIGDQMGDTYGFDVDIGGGKAKRLIHSQMARRPWMRQK